MTFNLNNPQRFLLICLSITAFTTAVSWHVQLTLMERVLEHQLKTISFEQGLFEQFYSCLCNMTTTGCIVLYDVGLNAQVINLEHFLDASDNSSSQKFSDYFKCFYDINTEVKCERQRQENVSCEQPSFLTSFRLLQPIACDVPCVGLQWSDQRESLIPNSTTQLQTCKGDCSEEITTVSIVNVTNSTVKTSPKDSEDNITSIVVGVVLGSLLLTSVVIIAILLWKMRRSTIKQFDSGTDIKMTDNSRTSTEMKGISGDTESEETEDKEEDDDVYENTRRQNQSGNYISPSTASRNANAPNNGETSSADPTYINDEIATGYVQATSASNYSQPGSPNAYSQLNEGMFPSNHSYEQFNKSHVDSQVSGTYSNSAKNDTYEDV